MTLELHIGAHVRSLRSKMRRWRFVSHRGILLQIAADQSAVFTEVHGQSMRGLSPKTPMIGQVTFLRTNQRSSRFGHAVKCCRIKKNGVKNLIRTLYCAYRIYYYNIILGALFLANFHSDGGLWPTSTAAWSTLGADRLGTCNERQSWRRDQRGLIIIIKSHALLFRWIACFEFKWSVHEWTRNGNSLHPPSNSNRRVRLISAQLAPDMWSHVYGGTTMQVNMCYRIHGKRFYFRSLLFPCTPWLFPSTCNT